MDLLVTEVLNHSTIIPQVYRTLSVPSLLGRIGCCMENMMIIGKRSTWMVNARSSNNNRFIGTKYLIGLPLKCVNAHLWQRLEDFALRYASQGSTVKVYCLHNMKDAYI